MRRKPGDRAFTLIEILVVMVVLIAIFAIVAPRYLGGKSGPVAKDHTPIARADSAVCMINLRSDRQAIEAAKDSDPDGQLPPTLAQVPGITPELTRCPVGGEPYVYDPQTGTVHCPHPGHENY